MFKRSQAKDYYLSATEVDNIFICDIMVNAPGDYVKVYLYALMAGVHRQNLSQREVARALGLSEETILAAWSYWEERGVIKTLPNSDPAPFSFDVEFMDLRDMLYGQAGAESEERKKPEIFRDGDTVKALYEYYEDRAGRLLTAREMTEIASWLNDLEASEPVIRGAMEYCLRRQKDNVNYIAKVVLQWMRDGLRTGEDVEEHLKASEERVAIYRQIMRRLGFTRNATEAERELVDNWMDGMGFNLQRILEACDQTLSISNPNLKYVNKVLENWREDAHRDGVDVNYKRTVTQSDINKYYEYLRMQAETQAEKRKAETYEKLPRVEELDKRSQALSRQLSMGVLRGLTQGETERIKKELDEIKASRAGLLRSAGLPEDYTDLRYSCEKCRDTGMDGDGRRCTCFKNRIGEAELWQKTQLKK